MSSVVHKVAALATFTVLCRYSSLSTTTSVLLSVTLAAISRCIFARKPSKEDMSVVTKILAHGSYPESVGAPDPIVHQLLWFNSGDLPTQQELIESIERIAFLPAYDRLVSLPVLEPGNEHWRLLGKEELNFENHVEYLELDSKDDIVNFASDLGLQEMKEGQPLWEFYIICNKNVEEDSVVIFRINHVIADGISMVGLSLSMVTDEEGNCFPVPDLKKFKKKNSSHSRGLKFLLSFIPTFFKVLSFPIVRDTDTIIHQTKIPFKFCNGRRLVLCDNITLSLMKEIKNSAPGRVTINDVCVSLLTGALRRYMEAKKDPALQSKDLRTRSLLPLGFPRNIDPAKAKNESLLENYWILMSMDIPLELPSTMPLERLQAASRITTALKQSPQALIQYALQELALKVLPQSLQFQTNVDCISRHHCVYTNVPGPQKSLFLQGHRINGIQTFLANLIHQICFVSYNGEMSMTWCVDESTIDEPELLRSCVNEELNALCESLHIKH